MERKTALIVGRTSGLGLELGLLFAEEYRVFISGRHDPGREGLECILQDLSLERRELGRAFDGLLAAVPSIDLLVYAAGFSQQGGRAILRGSTIIPSSLQTVTFWVRRGTAVHSWISSTTRSSCRAREERLTCIRCTMQS